MVPVMRLWFDILTPKQLLFFESMIKRLKKTNKVLCTSRNYREASELGKIRKINFVSVGKHGGDTKSGKLQASINRLSLLTKKIEHFSPDVIISFCSPEAARISHGLGIPHIAFCNAPHSEAVMKLTLPLIQKLITPSHIPKKEFSKFGISTNNIIQYKGMDEYLIVKNRPAGKKLNLRLKPTKTILFRTYESQASYAKKPVDTLGIIQRLANDFTDCNVLVLGRYIPEIKSMRKKFKENVFILDKVVDSGDILQTCDLFIGSGGTMTTEAILRGIPTISYNAVPNLDEKLLVRRNLIIRAESPQKISFAAKKLLSCDKRDIRKKSYKFLKSMEDPYKKLQSVLNDVVKS